MWNCFDRGQVWALACRSSPAAPMCLHLIIRPLPCPELGRRRGQRVQTNGFANKWVCGLLGPVPAGFGPKNDLRDRWADP